MGHTVAEENLRIMLQGSQAKRSEDALVRKCWKQLFEEDVSVGLGMHRGWDEDTLYIKHLTGSHSSSRRNTDTECCHKVTRE